MALLSFQFRDELAPAWHVWRGPAAAIVATLVARVLAHAMGRQGAVWLRAAGGALGALAGWAVLAGPGLLPLTAPRGEMARLPGAALVLVLAALGGVRGGRGGQAALPALPGAVAGWWLMGAPLRAAGIGAALPAIVALAGITVLAFHLIQAGGRIADSWRSAAPSLALAGALIVARVPPPWPMAALVPAAAALALLGGSTGLAAPPLAAAALLAAGATDLAAGRLPHGGFGALDAACLTPLVALWLAPRLLPGLARATPALAGLLAAAGCAGVVWAALRLLPLR